MRKEGQQEASSWLAASLEVTRKLICAGRGSQGQSGGHRGSQGMHIAFLCGWIECPDSGVGEGSSKKVCSKKAVSAAGCVYGASVGIVGAAIAETCIPPAA
jgi:hypothetical protein